VEVILLEQFNPAELEDIVVYVSGKEGRSEAAGTLLRLV